MSVQKQLERDCTEAAEWNIICHYDTGKEPADFMECMALFMLESEQGWDSCFRPVIEYGSSCHNSVSMGGSTV
ncbi:MAG TPA: hypothetical protein DCZ23_04455 [Lachnospiraceae bacterium]|nr:hypothetical protein [Lachnospiraceae bacterium]